MDAIDRVTAGPGSVKFSRKEPELFRRIGQILRAQVTKRLSEDLFLIRFAQRLVLAKAEVSLREGQDIALKIEQLAPQTVLKLLTHEKTEEEAKLQTRIMDLARILSKRRPLSSLITRISVLLEQVDHPEVQNLQQILALGLADSQKIGEKRSWKALFKFYLGLPDDNRSFQGSPEALLLSLLDSLPAGREELQSLIRDLLDQFFFLKEVNSHLKGTGLYLQIPYLYFDILRDIEIFVMREGSQGHQGRLTNGAYVTYLRLYLSAIGPIEITIKLLGRNGLDLKFDVKDQAIASLIKSNSRSLSILLNDVGLRLLELSCEVLPEDYWEKDFCLKFLDPDQAFLDLTA